MDWGRGRARGRGSGGRSPAAARAGRGRAEAPPTPVAEVVVAQGGEEDDGFPTLAGAARVGKGSPRPARGQLQSQRSTPNGQSCQSVQSPAEMHSPANSKGKRSSKGTLLGAKAWYSPDAGGGGGRRERSHGRGGAPTVTVEIAQVDERVKKIRKRMLVNEQVRLTTVIRELCDAYGVDRLRNLRGSVDPDENAGYCELWQGARECILHENSVRELLVIRRLEQNIDTFISAYYYTRQVCTLYSLNKHIAEHFGKKEFSELDMGPLTSHRLIKEKFKVHLGMRIPEISETDFYDLFFSYPHKSSKKSSMDDFLAWLATQKGVSIPEDLGIYIYRPEQLPKYLFSTCKIISSSQREFKAAWQKETIKRAKDKEFARLDKVVDATTEAAVNGEHLGKPVVDFLVKWRPLRAEKIQVTQQTIKWALQAAVGGTAHGEDKESHDGADCEKGNQSKHDQPCDKKRKEKKGKAAKVTSALHSEESDRYVPDLSIRSASAALAAFL